MTNTFTSQRNFTSTNSLNPPNSIAREGLSQLKNRDTEHNLFLTLFEPIFDFVYMQLQHFIHCTWKSTCMGCVAMHREFFLGVLSLLGLIFLICERNMLKSHDAK